jgi:hypothetical protein
MVIGFTRNEVPFDDKAEETKDDGELNFAKVREEFLSLESIERRDAYDDYNRTHRGLRP